MLSLLFPALLCLMPGQTPAPAPALKAPAAKPLSFASFRFPYSWDTTIPIRNAEVDGLKIDSIFFNKREATVWPLKGADFGTRAQIQVTNTSAQPRIPGFAVAVFDSDNRLVGVATGGPKIGGVRPGDTETFDLSFHQVVERIPRADHFILAVELTN